MSNRWLPDELGLDTNHPEWLDEWLWNNGSWGNRVDFILDGPGAQ
jgi:hypothetical protein